MTAKLDPDVRARLAIAIAKRYVEDESTSVTSLAEEVGRSYGFVHRVLTEQHVTLRARGGSARKKAK